MQIHDYDDYFDYDDDHHDHDHDNWVEVDGDWNVAFVSSVGFAPG